jgi:hypothetical protein
VFNTVEPATVRHVFRQVRHPLKIGVVHNPRREAVANGTRESGELLFCLHDYNYRLLEKDMSVDGYLSPFFKFRDLPSGSGSEHRVEIAVLGVVSFTRRDYPMLIELAEELAQQSPPPDVVFNILGDADVRDGRRLRRMISAGGLERFFTLHRWLPDAEFIRQFRRADYVMPLLRAGESTYRARGKVTAAYGHSGAFGTPLILDREVASFWGVPESTCVAYAGPRDLADRLNRGLGGLADRTQRYRSLISGKIQKNRLFLKNLSRIHPAFSHTRQ